MNLILMPTAAARLIAVGDASSGRPPLGYQDALDEALIAVEQVVIPRQQPIELLPRTAELLDMQVACCHLLLICFMPCVCCLHVKPLALRAGFMMRDILSPAVLSTV